MQAIVFFYNLKKVEPRLRTKLQEKLFGKVQRSNYNRYEYEIEGILSKGEYIRPVRAALIVKKKYTQGVMALFDHHGITYKIFEIKMESGDFKKYPFL